MYNIIYIYMYKRFLPQSSPATQASRGFPMKYAYNTLRMASQAALGLCALVEKTWKKTHGGHQHKENDLQFRGIIFQEWIVSLM